MASSELDETARNAIHVARYETSETLQCYETLCKALLETNNLYQSISMNREQQQTLVESIKVSNHHHDSSKSTTDTDVRRPTLFYQQPNTWTDSDGVYQPRHAGTDNKEGNKEDMLRSDVEIENLRQAEIKENLSNAQEAISSLSKKLHAN
eukprot:8196170-Ditylum_brightwellii.AAC.1